MINEFSAAHLTTNIVPIISIVKQLPLFHIKGNKAEIIEIEF